MQISTTYPKASTRKFPEILAIALAKDSEGKCNPITLGWVMSTSGQPPMLAISIALTRHSLDAIREAKAFVVALPSIGMAKEVDFFGTKSGRDMDKLVALGTPTQPATEIDCVLLSDAVANYECVLEGELLTGDHVIFVGRVVAAHINQDAQISRIYNLGGGEYGAVTGMGQ